MGGFKFQKNVVSHGKSIHYPDGNNGTDKANLPREEGMMLPFRVNAYEGRTNSRDPRRTRERASDRVSGERERQLNSRTNQPSKSSKSQFIFRSTFSFLFFGIINNNNNQQQQQQTKRQYHHSPTNNIHIHDPSKNQFKLIL